MTTHESDRHLSAELMQEFLDGASPPEDEARVREHASACVRCRSELDAWRTLFVGLGELEDVTPAPGFRERVLSSLPAPEPRARASALAARVKGWLGARDTVVSADGHLAHDRIQELLEGVLPRPDTVAAEAHLHACKGCREDVEGWRALLAALELPRVAPSPDFSEHVMAHVRVQMALATARPTLGERLQLLARMVSPETRKRAAALAGAAVTPAVTLGLVAYAVFSHPLVTLGNLVSFLWLKGSDLLAGSLGGVGERVTEGLSLLRTYGLVDQLAASPAAVAVTTAGLLGLTMAAAWVLYRNVLTPQAVDGTYVR